MKKKMSATKEKNEKKIYTVLDADDCHFYTGTLNEINDYLCENNITDVSDLTISEVKNAKSFIFNMDSGIIL